MSDLILNKPLKGKKMIEQDVDMKKIVWEDFSFSTKGGVARFLYSLRDENDNIIEQRSLTKPLMEFIMNNYESVQAIEHYFFNEVKKQDQIIETKNNEINVSGSEADVSNYHSDKNFVSVSELTEGIIVDEIVEITDENDNPIVNNNNRIYATWEIDSSNNCFLKFWETENTPYLFEESTNIKYLYKERTNNLDGEMK